MPQRRTPHVPRSAPCSAAAGEGDVSGLTADAYEFVTRHGDPATWTAEEFDVYLDLATWTPSPQPGGVVR